MKAVHKLSLFASVICIISLLAISGCRKDEPKPSELERIKTILTSGVWKIQSVSVDGTDQTSTYVGFTLAFTETTYTTTNGGVVWPASGSWTFAHQSGNLITRNDGLSVSVEEATETKLVLKLNWSKTTLGGRNSSIAGAHTFTFGK